MGQKFVNSFSILLALTIGLACLMYLPYLVSPLPQTLTEGKLDRHEIFIERTPVSRRTGPQFSI